MDLLNRKTNGIPWNKVKLTGYRLQGNSYQSPHRPNCKIIK